MKIDINLKPYLEQHDDMSWANAEDVSNENITNIFTGMVLSDLSVLISDQYLEHK